MIILAASDKGGTGRSVTSGNLVYRASLQGHDCCYVDFDFGSPTSGSIFGAESLTRGTITGRGLHSYLQGRTEQPEMCDLWTLSDRTNLRSRPAGAGRMVLVPGDVGGGEFSVRADTIERCGRLFRRLEEEFSLSIVDLSAGRSHAIQMALTVTANRPVPADHSRWLIFHRWTRQHVVAAHGLVFGDRGIVDIAGQIGHDSEDFLNRLRVVRTAVVDPDTADLSTLRPAQQSWLKERNGELHRLAAELGLGRSILLGTVPMDPILQWHEQLLTDRDLYTRQVANEPTVDALEELARRLLDKTAWELL
jgi:hypothetical protein